MTLLGFADIVRQHDPHTGRFRPFYVPREYMPQVDEQYLSRMIHDAVAAGHDPIIAVTDVKDLHAHQRVDHKRVAHMPDDLMFKPLLVSQDSFILDGNHRWWGHVRRNMPLAPTIRVNLIFAEAIEWLRSLPYVYEITPTTPERN